MTLVLLTPIILVPLVGIIILQFILYISILPDTPLTPFEYAILIAVVVAPIVTSYINASTPGSVPVINLTKHPGVIRLTLTIVLLVIINVINCEYVSRVELLIVVDPIFVKFENSRFSGSVGVPLQHIITTGFI